MVPRAVVSADSLNAVDLFRGLPPEQRSEIAARLIAVRHDAGAEIVTQADQHRDVFFILSGSVRVSFSVRSGKAVQFRDQGAGQMFGELSSIDGRPRSAEVMAISEVFLARADSTTFLHVASHYPLVAQRLFVELAGRVRSLSDRVIEFSTLGVGNRIHGELLRLALEAGNGSNHALVKPAPTHADIAARVSTHREAVTRELAALARRNIVKHSRGRLEFLDIARLEALVANLSEAP